LTVIHTRRRVGLTLASALLASSCWAPAWAQAAPARSVPSEAPFLAENDAAMDKMMKDMAVKPSGDVDRDFVAMMRPHHQGAIDMAQALLRYGHNEQLRRLAQEITSPNSRRSPPCASPSANCCRRPHRRRIRH